MTRATLRQAHEYAARGWPVFPCNTGQKTPATSHGHRDATTDLAQITAWFAPNPRWNLAIAAGAPRTRRPGRRPARPPPETGTPRSPGSARAGLIDGAAAGTSAPPAADCTPTSAASDQRNGHLPAHPWTSAPTAATSWPHPPRVDGKPYQLIPAAMDADGTLDWATVTAPAGTPAAGRPRPSRTPTPAGT